MKSIRKRSLVALGAAAAVLAIAGAAIAAGPPSSPPRLGQQGGQGYGIMAGGVVMDVAADYIGISETALAAARHDGTSLAQIAVDNGKSAAGLQEAVVAAFEVRLQNAVAAGTITSAQAETVREQLEARVQTMLTQSSTGPVAGRGGGGPGLGRAGGGSGLGLGPCGGVSR